MVIFTHLRIPGIYGVSESGLTYRWETGEWVPCINIPPDDEFRVRFSREEFPMLYRSMGIK